MYPLRMLVLSLAFGLSLAAGSAWAQTQPPLTFGLGGGMTVPLGDQQGFGLNGGPGLGGSWQGIGLLQIRPFRSNFGFQLDGTYQPYSASATSLTGRRMLNGTANLVYEFGHSRTSMVVPYIIGGAGVYSFQDRAMDNNPMRFGLNAGAGLNLHLGPGSFFLEGRFHNVFGAGLAADGSNASAHLIPITAGIKITGP
jgi:hypothetical protein